MIDPGALAAALDIRFGNQIRDVHARGLCVQFYDRTGDRALIGPPVLAVIDRGRGTGFVARGEGDTFWSALDAAVADLATKGEA